MASIPAADKPRKFHGTVKNSGDEKRVNGDDRIDETKKPEQKSAEPSSSSVRSRSRIVGSVMLHAMRKVEL